MQLTINGYRIRHYAQIVSVTPAQFFSKKRGLANGMVYAGGGLGGAVISYGLNGMIHRLGIPWTFRVLGFITLGTGLPAAWLIKERTIIRTNTMIEWYGSSYSSSR